jgi:hypothetical protein
MNIDTSDLYGAREKKDMAKAAAEWTSAILAGRSLADLAAKPIPHD